MLAVFTCAPSYAVVQVGSSTSSLLSNSPGSVRRCERISRRRWTLCMRSGTHSARFLTLRISARPCISVSGIGYSQKRFQTHVHPSAVVKEARKRILVMEYIKGGRVDDLVYLADNNIDRNKVALELARIFSQMVHINGWFHAVSDIRQLDSSVHSSQASVGSSPRCVSLNPTLYGV